VNILVCIKQILAPEAVSAALGDSGGTFGGSEAAAGKGTAQTSAGPSFTGNFYRMNPYDEHALEEALRIREQFPEAKIDAVAVGPDRCRQVLRRALEMGADRAVLLQVAPPGTGGPEGRPWMQGPGETPPAGAPGQPHSPEEPDPTSPKESFPPAALTPYETAAVIAAYLRDKSYDLILAGVMAEDGMAGQTGQLLAGLLAIPCVTAVISERLLSPHGPVYAEREEDGGGRAAYEITLPALLTIQSGINRPRYPALSHVLRARTQEIMSVAAAGLLPPPRERVAGSRRRESSPQCVFLTGSLPEQARQFLDFCRQRGFIRR